VEREFREPIDGFEAAALARAHEPGQCDSRDRIDRRPIAAVVALELGFGGRARVAMA
jgi:hypothetical protein